MTQQDKLKIEEEIVRMLRTVFDPEIPVNVYDLGLIYRIEVHDDAMVDIDMTFTSPTCPVADFIFEDVRIKVESIEGVKGLNLQFVTEPVWTPDMATEEARLEMGYM